ncbi:unnamed protein product [Heligmosomoides polygyrus]|uniref:JmjC domain-containing protein n=1 Tax=Heligmosomoides polygyrus TaxID=6339 RepID=A0A183GDE1_HELPZ|nr:unnamed protein product [Heligmosomoides polygyrus]
MSADGRVVIDLLTLKRGSPLDKELSREEIKLAERMEGPLYLAQHRLFEQVPQLCDNFSLPLYCDHCEVDALNPDLVKYPQFAQVRCWDGVVEGGDVLFIPKGWWHLVASLSSSISISFWFDK